MTENKRFTLEMQYWKGNPQGRKLFDNLIGQEGMSVEELCNIASDLHSKCEELESVLKVYEDCLSKLEDENKELKEENEQLKETINEVKTDEKQLSISFRDYKMQLIEVLQQNYNYAYSQRQKNLDKSIVAKTYEVLAQTVCHIAETMNVDIERFPRDGDVE